MRKLMLFTLLGLCSCIGSPDEISYADKHRVDLKVKDYTVEMSIYEYEYNGHKYQYHYTHSSYGGTGGPVHDPNCPCYNDSVK